MLLNYICPIYSTLDQYSLTLSLCHYFCHFLFSCEVMSNSLRPYVLQHAQLPCSLLFPTVCSDLCPLSQWCSLTISSSTALFSFCLQPFPSSGSFPMSQLFILGGQIIGASASVLPMNIQGWFPLGLTSLISLQSKEFSRVFSSTIIRNHKFCSTESSLWFTSHVCTWVLEKP